MKYLSLLPLAGLAIAAPGWSDADPAKSTTTTAAAVTESWSDIPEDVTVTETATGTYCDKTHKLTKPAGPGGECTIDVTTVTVATATVTAGGHGGKPADSTVTVTETVTAGGHGGKPAGPGEEVTVTETTTKTVGGKDSVTVTVTDDCSAPTDGPGHGGPGGPPAGGKCLSDDAATKIVDNFRTLLEYTSYNGTQGAPGRGYKYDVSKATLAEDFVDISDSINFMAGFPLGSVTFANKTAFDFGQGVLQPEVLTETLNTFHDCSSITWRWKLTPKIPNAYPVVGINYMEINEDGLIAKNYAEFNNGAWLQSFGRQCAINPVSTVSGEWAKKI